LRLAAVPARNWPYHPRRSDSALRQNACCSAKTTGAGDYSWALARCRGENRLMRKSASRHTHATYPSGNIEVRSRS